MELADLIAPLKFKATQETRTLWLCSFAEKRGARGMAVVLRAGREPTASEALLRLAKIATEVDHCEDFRDSDFEAVEDYNAAKRIQLQLLRLLGESSYRSLLLREAWSRAILPVAFPFAGAA